MPNPHRQEKLGEQIAVEVSDLLRTRVKDPRVGFASITHVEVSGDLRHAKIYVSVMGESEEKQNTIEALRHATGFIRRELAGRLTVRFMPEIVFKLDNSIEQGAHVLGLIRKLVPESASGQAAESGNIQAQNNHEVIHESD
ncbi:MAG TPA: 30S ribosome-binding factor RbfA [Ktedonobacteraceae bacterium]|jgi:ribosome-binding factor A|nr:30S ribosome-binding factor RbfA [Ktedonobacteraceae bacterium]